MFNNYVEGEFGIFDSTATREIGERLIKTLDNGTSNSEIAELFEGFVEDITRIEVGSDEDVGFAGNGGSGGLFASNAGVNCGVKLHFAVDDIVGVVFADFGDDVINLFEIRVFATRAVGGVGKHGDFGSLASVFYESLCGVFDDGVELVGGGELVNAAIGESEDLVGFFTNKTAREKAGF